MHKVFLFFLFVLLLSSTVHAGLYTASEELVEELMDQLDPLTTEISYREGNYVDLPVGRNVGLRVGQIFEIYSQETARYLGKVKIEDVRSRSAEALILEEREQIQAGDQADEVVGGKVAVLGFLDSQGRETGFSISFQDHLINALARYGGFEVIERRQLEQHLEEVKLSYTGLLERDAPEAGRLLGTDYIVVGGVTQLTDDIIINARINETATGRMLASARVTLSRTHSLENLMQTIIQEDYHQEKRVEEVQDATRLEIIPEGPTSIFPGESVELRASKMDMVGGTEFISMVHARWYLAADSLQLASLSSSEGNIVVITALSSGPVTLRATYDTYSTTIQLEVKELPYLRDIAISPPLSSIYTGEVQEFTLKGFNQYGDPITASAEWTILMGEGRLSRDRGESTFLEAHKAGVVVVQASAGGMTVAGSVEVLESPSVLTSLQVKPRGPIQLEEGESIRLSALAFDQFQEEMGTPLHWSIIRGTGRLSSSSGEEIIFTGSTSGTVVVKVASEKMEAEVEIQVTYRVSGQVLDEEERGILGVRVEFSGGYSSVTTGSDGRWSRDGLQGTVIVTPKMDGYTFREGSRQVTGAVTGLNFTGSYLLYELSGRVVDSGGRGIEGVIISFSGDHTSVTTDSSGDWRKGGLQGRVTVTPIRDGYTFTPTRREVQGGERSVGFTGEQVLKDDSSLVERDFVHITIAHRADAITLDPHDRYNQPSFQVMSQIYETLVYQDTDLHLGPGLALSWEQVDDLAWDFYLRPGVMFHNGEILTAHDVKFTLDRLKTSDSSYIVDFLKEVEVIDELSFRIYTKLPYAPLLNHLAHPITGILNEKAVVEAGDDYGSLVVVGSGPFQLKSWSTENHIVLEMLNSYWGKPAKADQITFQNIHDNTVRATELEVGNVDIIYNIDPIDEMRLAALPTTVLSKGETLETIFIGFNAQIEPFDNILVRQALNHAVNVSAMIELIYNGQAVRAAGPLPGIFWRDNYDLTPYTYDLTKAQALLAEAGYPDGFNATIFTMSRPHWIQIVEMVQADLRKIGVDIEIQVLNFAPYLADTLSGKHEMFIWSRGAGGPIIADADRFLYNHFHSSVYGHPCFWSHPKVDAALDLGRSTSDPEIRAAGYYDAQKFITEKAPCVFLVFTTEVNGLKANIEGFVPHPTGLHRLFNVTKK